MHRVVYVIAVAIAAASAVAEEPIPTALAQGRDLHAYDDGGVYRATGGYIADVQRLREFVWSHWTKRQRAYVKVVFQGVDTGTEAYLFIEPMDGHWRIYWDEIFYSALPGSSPLPPVFYPTIVTVERCRGSLIFFDADDRIVKYL
jgi:hypothetical protein